MGGLSIWGWGWVRRCPVIKSLSPGASWSVACEEIYKSYSDIVVLLAERVSNGVRLSSSPYRLVSSRWNSHPTLLVYASDRSGLHPCPPASRFPPTLARTPAGVLVFERINVMRGIILWLAGVPLVVIIGLYLFHVI